MIRQARSKSGGDNPRFTPLQRLPDERNGAWGNRAVGEMGAQAGPDAWTYIALLGASDTLAFRLRVAQSHLRPDMLPSYWSDAILVQLAGRTLEGATAVSVPLTQPAGPAYAPKDNGVVVGRLSDFDDPKRYPNIALIALPVPQAKIVARSEAFRTSRSSLDALEHVLRWLAFAWGVARTGNPLFENYGIPSAGFLETVCAAEDFDLTPGLESRASCPEAIWAAARHWHEYFAKTAREAPVGRYVIGHGYDIMESPGPEPAPFSGAPAAAPARPASLADEGARRSGGRAAGGRRRSR